MMSGRQTSSTEDMNNNLNKLSGFIFWDFVQYLDGLTFSRSGHIEVIYFVPPLFKQLPQIFTLISEKNFPLARCQRYYRLEDFKPSCGSSFELIRGNGTWH
jgi:hypothetical protein